MFGSGGIRTREDEPRNADMQALQVIQNNMLRSILHISRSSKTRIRDMLHETGMLSVNQMCAADVLVQAWKAREFTIDPLNGFCSAVPLRLGLRSEFPHRTDAKSKEAFPVIANKLWNLATERLRKTYLLTVARSEAKKFAETLPV